MVVFDSSSLNVSNILHVNIVVTCVLQLNFLVQLYYGIFCLTMRSMTLSYASWFGSSTRNPSNFALFSY